MIRSTLGSSVLGKDISEVRVVTWKTGFRKTNPVNAPPLFPRESGDGSGARSAFINRGVFRHQLVLIVLTALGKGSHAEEEKKSLFQKQKKIQDIIKAFLSSSPNFLLPKFKLLYVTIELRGTHIHKSHVSTLKLLKKIIQGWGGRDSSWATGQQFSKKCLMPSCPYCSHSKRRLVGSESRLHAPSLWVSLRRQDVFLWS